MTPQQRTAITSVIATLERDGDEHGVVSGLRQALGASERAARPLAAPVTDDEIDATYQCIDMHGGYICGEEMRRALEGFAAGRAAVVEPAVVPDGWKMVPICLTPEMRTELLNAYGLATSELYTMLLAAAPQPSTPAVCRNCIGTGTEHSVCNARPCGFCSQPAAQPVALTPMTEPKMAHMVNNMGTYRGDWGTAIIRATEKHHGITGEP